MLTRRRFFAVATAVAVAAALPEQPKLSAIWRQTPEGWDRCRMFELRIGDVFRMEGQDGRLLTATTAPYKDENGIWEIVSETKLVA